MCDSCGGTCGDATSRRAGLFRHRAAGGSITDDATDVLAPSYDRLAEVIEPVHRALRSLNAVPLLGAAPMLVNGSATGVASSSVMSGSAGRLAGFGIRETTGNTGALIRLLNGTDATGDLIAPITLNAGQSLREWYLPHGIAYTYGLFVQIVSGSVEAVIYIGRDR